MTRLFKNFIKLLYQCIGYYTVKIKDVSLKVHPKHLGFWRNAARGQWEPETYEILDTYLTPDMNYLDIGAWIGSTVLFAAKKCQQVICFEPDPIAYKYLLTNIQLNKFANITSHNIALSNVTGFQQMASLGDTLGDSMTSLLSQQTNDTALSFTAFTLQWDIFISNYPISQIDFIKIDIEGAEFFLLKEIIPYLKQYKPILYLSTHAPFLAKEQRLKAMQELASNLDFYTNCLDESQVSIPFKEIANQKNTTRCTSFVFLP